MAKPTAEVAVFGDHDEAEKSVQHLASAGIDITTLSILESHRARSENEYHLVAQGTRSDVAQARRILEAALSRGSIRRVRT
jgi:hypothetical protein